MLGLILTLITTGAGHQAPTTTLESTFSQNQLTQKYNHVQIFIPVDHGTILDSLAPLDYKMSIKS